MPQRLQQMVDELAEELQRSVMIDDADCRLITSSPHYGDADQTRTAAFINRANPPTTVVSYLRRLGTASWREPTHVPSRPELVSAHGRVCRCGTTASWSDWSDELDAARGTKRGLMAQLNRSPSGPGSS